MIRLAKDGARELILATMLLPAIAAGALWLSGPTWFGWAGAVPPMLIWLWVLYFFRDPTRKTPEGEGLFISPADGTVSDITPLGEDGELGREGVRIGVFMSVFSVHVNRGACDGVVTAVDLNRGKFLDVRREKAWNLNEAATITLQYEADGESYPVIVRQVAGLVARRIVCHLKPGDRMTRGERFGMIKFGSRLELLLPTELADDIRVKVGDKAVAGETILATHAPRTQGDD